MRDVKWLIAGLHGLLFKIMPSEGGVCYPLQGLNLACYVEARLEVRPGRLSTLTCIPA